MMFGFSSCLFHLRSWRLIYHYKFMKKLDTQKTISIIFKSKTICNQQVKTLYNLFFKLTMQGNHYQLRELIITDLQKSIELKQVIQYLRTYKLFPKINKFSKFQDKIKIQFIDEKDAYSFYYQNCFMSRIITRKFNIYYSFFDDPSNKIVQYELTGNLENNIRQIFLICNMISKCCFRFSIQNSKLNFTKCILQLEGDCVEEQIINNLQLKLSQIQVSIRKLEKNQNQDNLFKCSIEIVNFQQIKSIKMDQQELKVVKNNLQLLILKICSEPIKQIEITTFEDIQMQISKIKVKAFFRFSNYQLTMQLFQKLRIYFLDHLEIDIRIYYFEHQANNFMTLFTTGLLKPIDMNCKHFQDQILTSFRNINAKIVQVIVKQGYGHLFTAKIYMADQESGKQLISDYNKNRPFIFRLYKDKSKISINLFQKIVNINEMKKIETNTRRILSNMREAKLQEIKFKPIPLNHPSIYKPYPYPKTNTKPKYRQLQGQYQDNNRKQSNFAIEKHFYLKEQQFPSI